MRKPEAESVFDNNPDILDNDFFSGGMDSFFGNKFMTKEIAKADQ